MCGPVGGYLSDTTKTTAGWTKSIGPLGGAGIGSLLLGPPGTGGAETGALFGKLGVSPLDPLGLGPSLFDDPKVPKPKPPPPPVDETKILFREMARTQTEQALRQRRTSRKPGGV